MVSRLLIAGVRKLPPALRSPLDLLLQQLRLLKVRLRIRLVGVPRVLTYSPETNAMFLRECGARISRKNVRLLSPITLHRANLSSDFSNLSIADGCLMNGNNFLDLSAPVTLESGVSLGPGVILMSHNAFNGNAFLEDRLRHTVGEQGVLIREGAGIKAGAVIVMGVTVGRNAVVAAQALVNRDIPDNCLAAGVPAKVVRELT